MTPGLELLCKGIAINIRPIAKINALFNKKIFYSTSGHRSDKL